MHFFENLQTDGINHFFIGKIVLALQVKMPPTHDRIVPDGLQEFIPAFFAIVLGEFFGEKKVVPTNKGIFNQPTAAFGNVLVFLFALAEGMVIPQRYRFGQFIRPLHFVELFLNRLPKFEVVCIPQDKQRLGNLTKLFQCLIKRVLLRVGIQSPKKLRCCRFLA